MILKILGRINGRIDVGINTSNGNAFIHTSSNAPEFTPDELDTLVTVLSIINMIPDGEIEHQLSIKNIPLWEPSPPSAEIKI